MIEFSQINNIMTNKRSDRAVQLVVFGEFHNIDTKEIKGKEV